MLYHLVPTLCRRRVALSVVSLTTETVNTCLAGSWFFNWPLSCLRLLTSSFISLATSGCAVLSLWAGLKKHTHNNKSQTGTHFWNLPIFFRSIWVLLQIFCLFCTSLVNLRTKGPQMHLLHYTSRGSIWLEHDYSLHAQYHFRTWTWHTWKQKEKERLSHGNAELHTLSCELLTLLTL